MGLALWSCADRSTEPTVAQTGLSVDLRSNVDTSKQVQNAFVVVYDTLNQAVASGFSDASGHLEFTLPVGKYHLQIDAQGFWRYPRVGGIAPVTQVNADQMVPTRILIDVDSSTANLSAVFGTLRTSDGAAIAGARVVAVDAQGGFGEIMTAPDGSFALFNLDSGNYALTAFKAAYQIQQKQALKLASNTTQKGIDLRMTVNTGTRLRGSVSFLASQNGRVDITLLDPVTLLPIPGLVAFNDTGSTYQLSGIPAGDYIAWGSFQNDGYVMDPDAIRKFGLPKISVKPTDTSLQLNFSITGSDTLLSPSNLATSAIAADVKLDSLVFRWAKYPSAKEYYIEVRDSRGRVIWGGIDSVQSFMSKTLDAKASSCTYNFDGSAKENLKVGEVYHWKIWADRDAAAGIQGLITSSEDQMGFFRIIAP